MFSSASTPAWEYYIIGLGYNGAKTRHPEKGEPRQKPSSTTSTTTSTTAHTAAGLYTRVSNNLLSARRFFLWWTNDRSSSVAFVSRFGWDRFTQLHFMVLLLCFVCVFFFLLLPVFSAHSQLHRFLCSPILIWRAHAAINAAALSPTHNSSNRTTALRKKWENSKK